MRLHFQNVRSVQGYGYHVWLMRDMPDGTTQMAKPVTFEWDERVTGLLIPKAPTFELTEPELESLADSYKRDSHFGGGPRLGGLTAALQLEAVKNHLEDMRKLVFERPR